MVVGELVQQLLQRAASRLSARYVLGIAGPPGAGKSTLAARLRDALGASVAEIAAMDGFHLTNSELAARGWTHQKGEPHTFDRDAFVSTLRQLRSSRDVHSAPGYDRNLHEPVPGGARFGPETVIVITEGNYLLLDDWPQVRSCLDEAWYLHADRELIAKRLYERHVRGGKSPDVARRKVETSDLANADLVAATASRADLVLAEQAGTYRLLKPYGQ